MKCREWDLDQDYTILEKWCKEYKWDSVIPRDILPPQGLIIEDKEPICALGLYLNPEVKFGYMYGIFSNPKIGKIKKYKAMKMILKEVKKLAKKQKIEIILTHTAEKALEKMYIKHGDMEYGEKNVKSYIMNLSKKKYTNLDWLK